jgi:glycosyltransferase involved in cell wall biosynthesis
VALRKHWGAADDDPVVLYVGRLAAEKNMPVLFSTFEQIQRAVPSARLVLVGDGPQRAELTRRYPQHVFAGMRHGVDLAAHYASGDVFLFPSVTETFGNVTLEAMASGLAVVAYDYAAAREHIVGGRNGMLAAFDDGEAFCRVAVVVATNATLRNGLRRAARMTASQLDWERVVDDLASALLDLIAQPERAHG